MDTISLALQELERFGYDNGRHQHFMDAHAQGRCHRCHVPYANTVPDCPCPHWLIMPWPTASRVDTSLEMVGLCGVLNFLLLYTRATLKGRRNYRGLKPLTTQGRMGIQVRHAKRSWEFSLQQPRYDRLLVELKTRSPKELSTWLPATNQDISMLEAVVNALRKAAVGPGIHRDSPARSPRASLE